VRDRPVQHSALDARDDMLAIADAWPDLQARLGREGLHGSDGMPKPVTRIVGLIINEFVSDTMREISDWVWFLVRVLVDETDWQAPKDHDTPALLACIARTRVGHFTAHPDKSFGEAFTDDAKRLRALATRVAYPDGYRTLNTRIPCEFHDTSDTGGRIVCRGTYTVRPLRDDTMPDLICSTDRSHRISPDVWSRSGWKRSHERVSA